MALFTHSVLSRVVVVDPEAPLNVAVSQVPTITDLHKAVKTDDFPLFEQLLMLMAYSEGTLKDSLTANTLPGGQTILLNAILAGRTNFVQLLLTAPDYSEFLDFEQGEKDGYTCYHAAAFQGRSDIVKLLMKRGIPGGMSQHKDGYFPIHRACWGMEEKHTLSVKAFLDFGVPVDWQGKGKSCFDVTKNEGTKELIANWGKEL